jgi:DNA mismatch repair protein MutS2
LEWKKTENKDEVMKQIQNLLFRKKEQAVTNKLAKKIEAKYKEVNGDIVIGSKVKMKKSHQVGKVKEIRGKRAVVQIGLLPMSVELSDLVLVEEKENAT